MTANSKKRSRQKPTACKVCAFTGYRPQKMPWGLDEMSPLCLEFKFRLRESLEYLIGMGYADFLSGSALGFDLMAAEIVLSLRQKYPWVRLIMVIPFDGQADKWPEEQRRRRAAVMEASDRIIYISHAFDRGVYFRRNRAMVERADLLLAAYDGRPGGTEKTVAYAHSRGTRVLRLSPVRRMRVDDAG